MTSWFGFHCCSHSLEDPEDSDPGGELYENTMDVRDALFGLLCRIPIVLKLVRKKDELRGGREDNVRTRSFKCLA
jgi:hypothetical protein